MRSKIVVVDENAYSQFEQYDRLGRRRLSPLWRACATRKKGGCFSQDQARRAPSGPDPPRPRGTNVLGASSDGRRGGRFLGLGDGEFGILFCCFSRDVIAVGLDQAVRVLVPPDGAADAEEVPGGVAGGGGGRFLELVVFAGGDGVVGVGCSGAA